MASKQQSTRPSAKADHDEDQSVSPYDYEASFNRDAQVESQDIQRNETISTTLPAKLHGWRLNVLVAGLCLSVLLVGLDFTMLATAVPTITTEFDSLHDVGWYGSAFLICVCACQLLAGNLFERFSHKWLYGSFVVVFEIGSLVSALAPNSASLIVGRAVTGIGASGLFGGSLIVIASAVPTEVQPLYVGVIQGVFVLSEVVGPILGGAFTQQATWRWCFWVNLPIGAVTLLVILLTLAETQQKHDVSAFNRLRSLDLIGFSLFSGSMIMLLSALQWGGTTYPWRSSTIIGLIIGFALTLTTFIGWQAYLGDEASIPPSLIKNRTIFFGLLGAIFGNGGFHIVLYYLQIWFQAVKGVTPLVGGLMYLPTVAANIVAAVIGAMAVTKLPYHNPFLLFGIACLAMGAGLDTMLEVDSHAGYWAGFQIFCGTGFAFLVQMPIVGVQRNLAPTQVTMGTTVLVLGFSLSPALLLAISQPVFESVLQSSLAKYAPSVDIARVIRSGATGFRSIVDAEQVSGVVEAYNSAITRVFFVTVGCSLASFLFACGLPWIAYKPPKPCESVIDLREKTGTE